MALKFITLLNLVLLILATKAYGNLTHTMERSGRSNLVSFKPLGQTVLIGLDLLIPFLTVPTGVTKVDQYGNQKALINIDTASLVVSGLITGTGLLLGQVFRTFPRVAARDNELELESDETERAGRTVNDNLNRMFEPFKLVYTNATGERVETTLAELLYSIEGPLLENDVDLPACIEKSVCSMVSESSEQLRSGNASGVHKIIDGLTQLKWLLSMLRKTTFYEAIETGRLSSNVACDVKYPRCKWAAPQTKLFELLQTYVRFT